MKNKTLLSLLSLLLIFVLVVSTVSCVFINPEFTTTQSTKNEDNNISGPEDENREPIDYTSTFYLIDALFRNYSIFEIDYEKAMLAAIKAYVEITGDKYAMFYTPDELDEMQAENQGDLYGIGVQVIFDYKNYYMEVVLIMPDSPAESELKVGDLVTHIYVDGEKVALSDLVDDYKIRAKELYPHYTEEEINNVACYEAFQYAITQIKGPINTYAEFTVVRDGESYEYKIERAQVKTVSVTSKVSIKDPTVGIVSISQFDMTTPVQFQQCMDALILSGCDKFVFDVRNNPGGDVASIVAVVSTLLKEEDVILSTKDHKGNETITKVKEVNYSLQSGYSTCNVSKHDIGKYSGYKYAVLANENSASAAELFTAVLRDYDIAEVIGTKTFGKGSMQSVIDLKQYGPEYHGALKLTTRLYFPPCGIGYDGGIGIEPDYVVELEGIAAETNFFKLTEDIDNQLQKAVASLID